MFLLVDILDFTLVFTARNYSFDTEKNPYDRTHNLPSSLSSLPPSMSMSSLMLLLFVVDFVLAMIVDL